MKFYKITDDSFETLKPIQRPLALLFSSRGCHLCIGLKPVYKAVGSLYDGQFDFGVVDIDGCPKLKEKFIEEGVPTICILFDGIAYYIPEPTEPEKHIWYSADYIKKQLNAFTEGDFYSWNAQMI